MSKGNKLDNGPKMAGHSDRDILINDFAIRCFRDTADSDYISARLNYRHKLITQFYWSSLQAMEKYFKCVLLLNRISSKHIGHDLSRAQKAATNLPFNIDLSASSIKLIENLDRFGRFRYLETSYYIHGPQLVELDKAVWELRRYCKVLNYNSENGENVVKNMLEFELEKIERSKKEHPFKSRILGGRLEGIIENKRHPARSPLIWQNGFFGSRPRNSVKMRIHMSATNSPLTLHPEILDDVVKYVHLSKDVIKAYGDYLSETRTKSNKDR